MFREMTNARQSQGIFNALALSSVRVLNLYGCWLGDDGTVAFSQALFFNGSLVCVSLAPNCAGDVGVAALAEASNRCVPTEQEALFIDKLANDESRERTLDEGLARRGKEAKGRPPPKKPPPKPPRGKATNLSLHAFLGVPTHRALKNLDRNALPSPVAHTERLNAPVAACSMAVRSGGPW